MIKLVKRSASRASSRAKLADRVRYITDPNEPDHIGKLIHPAKNYNCPSQSGDDFSDEVIRLQAKYKKHRAGKRGKRSPRIFEEIIYSTPEGVFPTRQEREHIESMVICLVGDNTACRCAWHIDQESGRADLHILMAAKDHDGQVALWAHFGGKAGRHIYAEFDRLDEEIAAYLNPQNDPKLPIKSAAAVRRKDNVPFAAELAEKHPAPITPDALLHTLAILGYTVSRITKKTVSIIFPGKKRPHRYNIEDLLFQLELAQERIRMRVRSKADKEPKKEPENPSANTPPLPGNTDKSGNPGDIT